MADEMLMQLKYGNEKDVLEEVKQAGAILFATDTGKIYFDDDEKERHQMSDMNAIKNASNIQNGQEGGSIQTVGKNRKEVDVSSQAGCMAFKILSYEYKEGQGIFELSTVKDIITEKDKEDYCYAHFGDEAGEKITKIIAKDTNTNTITVENGENKADKFNSDKSYLIILNSELKIKNIEGDKPIGDAAFAEGYQTIALSVASHSEGYNTKALGKYAHAEGNSAIAGFAAHAEGRGSQALGVDSHAEGANTKAVGARSHAEGNVTYASGIASHAEGHNTEALYDFQHVSGKYNKSGEYAVIVGNGKGGGNQRSNAYTLDWEGNGVFAGTVSSKDGELATKGYVDSQVGNINNTIETTFATKDYVNSQISSNNNNYYTKTEVNGIKNDLQSNISTNASSISALNQTVTDLGSSISTLKGLDTEVQTHTEDIKSLDKRVTTLENTTATSWKNVQDIVRRGFGPTVYPIGYQFTVHHKEYGDIIFDVVAHDYLKKADDEDAHTMTLLAHDSILTTQFDAREVLYIVNSDEENGVKIEGNKSYCISDETNGDGWYHIFSFDDDVPNNSKLLFRYEGNSITGLMYYNENNDLVYTKKGEEGYQQKKLATKPTDTTILGNARYPDLKNLNHNSRAQNGNNNYRGSAIRQFLNSSNEKGKWWEAEAENNFEMPPSDASKRNGFLFDMDKNFLEVVGKVKLPCFTHNNKNAAPEGSVNTSYNITEDLFYLPSLKEIIGNLTDANDITENDKSILLPYYNKASNVDKIKYDLFGNKVYWFSRSPYLTNGGSVRGINSGGTINSYGATDNRGIVPMCTIM